MQIAIGHPSRKTPVTGLLLRKMPEEAEDAQHCWHSSNHDVTLVTPLFSLFRYQIPSCKKEMEGRGHMKAQPSSLKSHGLPQKRPFTGFRDLIKCSTWNDLKFILRGRYGIRRRRHFINGKVCIVPIPQGNRAPMAMFPWTLRVKVRCRNL